MYTQLGVLTKGTVIEVNVSELGMVTAGGKVVFGKYAQITNNPENDGCINAVLRALSHNRSIHAMLMTDQLSKPIDIFPMHCIFVDYCCCWHNLNSPLKKIIINWPQSGTLTLESVTLFDVLPSCPTPIRHRQLLLVFQRRDMRVMLSKSSASNLSAC